MNPVPLVIRNYETFDTSFLTFHDNCVYGGMRKSKSYFLLQTPLCRIISKDTNGIWVHVPEKFAEIIDHIDIEFISQRSSNIHEYLNGVKINNPSMKLSANGARCYLHINLRNFTRVFGNANVNDSVWIILNCNYTKRSLIWNAYQIRNNNIEVEAKSDEEDQEPVIFNDCCLHEPELVKI